MKIVDVVIGSSLVCQKEKTKKKRTERKGKLDVFTQEAIWIREGETTPAAVSNRH